MTGGSFTDVNDAMFRGPLVVLTILTAVIPALPWALLFVRRTGERMITRQFALLVGTAQVAVLALNAISRQVVQNIELEPYMQRWGEAVQWSPLIAFLVVFLTGAGVTIWMLVQAFKPFEPSGAKG
jgi:uncharacterized membrane protein YhaH (DUF805 family)